MNEYLPGMIPVDEIQITNGDFTEFFEQYFNHRKPAVLKNAMTDWSLLKKWSPEYIIEEFGDYGCTLISDGRPAYAKDVTTLKNYFEEHLDKSTLTLKEFTIQDVPGFFNDIPFPNPLFSEELIRRYFFFHAPLDGGTLPHLHHDAFNMLTKGNKHWVLHDAGRQTNPGGNQVMREFLKKYPIGAQAKDWFKNELASMPSKVDEAYEAFQEPGDIVYVPSEFSHTVLNNGEVMGLVVERLRDGK
jgi:hypothetical protein